MVCYISMKCQFLFSSLYNVFYTFRAKKANLTHPEIPVIARCHNYSISTKYTYQCSKCGYRLVVFEIMEVRCICMYAFFFAQCFIH